MSKAGMAEPVDMLDLFRWSLSRDTATRKK